MRISDWSSDVCSSDLGGYESHSRLPAARHSSFRHHAAVVGYGRVGRVVGRMLRSEALPVILVDKDRRRVNALRERGITAIYDDASTPDLPKTEDTAPARLHENATPAGINTSPPNQK